ncbi:MAG TPA: hypothetical protein PKV72_02705 [Candidatus Peribacteria bacterium]|nr:hypothetical protein [Candidatus Peribacteria bacterium]
MSSLERNRDVLPQPELVTHAPQPRGIAGGIVQARRYLGNVLAGRHAPGRVYECSDTFGGPGWDPLHGPDIDVHISTDFAGHPHAPVRRQYDTFGHERVTDHVLRLVLQQHDELGTRPDLSRRSRRQAQKLGTGVFVNYAPRIDGTNASPFWLATARGGEVRVVATPLSSLSAIRDHIETLQYLPNPQKGDPHNGLYDSSQQFRSKYTPRLLDPYHGLELVDADPAIIPAPDGGWHVSFVDRYGNVITHTEDPEGQWQEIQRIADQTGDTRGQVELTFGNGDPRRFTLGTTLGASQPGQPTVYRNGGIDLVRKWTPQDDADSKHASSAWVLAGKPRLGDRIRVNG